VKTYDFPPIDRMNVERPTQHAIMFLAYPSPADAAEISARSHRFRDMAGLRGRPLSTDRLHITLFNLGVYGDGERYEDVIAQACKAAAMMASSPIEIVLDRLQTFRRNSSDQPLVLTGSDGVKPLLRFREELAMALIDSGLRRFAVLGSKLRNGFYGVGFSPSTMTAWLSHSPSLLWLPSATASSLSANTSSAG